MMIDAMHQNYLDANYIQYTKSKKGENAIEANFSKSLLGAMEKEQVTVQQEGNNGVATNAFDDDFNKKLDSNETPSTYVVNNDGRSSMPTSEATEIIHNDFQLQKAWNLYSWTIPDIKEIISPSEFLSKINSITEEQLAQSPNKVTDAQREGIQKFYSIQSGDSSLNNKSPERQIELINRMFAAGLIEHNPTTDVNIGAGLVMAEYGPEGPSGMPLIWKGRERIPLIEHAFRDQLVNYLTGPEELVNRIKVSLAERNNFNDLLKVKETYSKTAYQSEDITDIFT